MSNAVINTHSRGMALTFGSLNTVLWVAINKHESTLSFSKLQTILPCVEVSVK